MIRLHKDEDNHKSLEAARAINNYFVPNQRRIVIRLYEK